MNWKDQIKGEQTGFFKELENETKLRTMIKLDNHNIDNKVSNNIREQQYNELLTPENRIVVSKSNFIHALHQSWKDDRITFEVFKKELEKHS